jgi:hypothetical protein
MFRLFFEKTFFRTTARFKLQGDMGDPVRKMYPLQRRRLPIARRPDICRRFDLCYNCSDQTMIGEPAMAKDKDKGKEKGNKPKLSVKDKKKKKKEKLEKKASRL